MIRPMSSPEVFEYERLVAFSETDMAGVAHFSAILRWIEEAESAFLRRKGDTLCRRDEHHSLIGWPKVALNVEFLSPVRFEETLVVVLTLAREGRSSREWRFEIRRKEDSAEVARGMLKSVRVRIAPDGRLTPLSIK